MPGDKRLKGLAAIHFVAGLVAGFLATNGLHASSGLGGLLLVPFVALVSCQAFLLALWGVISSASPWKRIAGLLVGSIYLETLWLLSLGTILPGTSSVTIGVAIVSLLVVRATGGKFTGAVHNGRQGQAETERLKFSIRGLMLLTAAFALLGSVARALQSLSLPENRLTPFTGFLAVCFVTVGFAAVWAVLGNARPLERAAAVLVLSSILGVFVAVAANAQGVGWANIILSMFFNSVALLVSLVVVRSSGYRFVRHA